MNIIIGILILLFSTLTSSAGALLLKEAMNHIDRLSITKVITSLWAWGGVVFYIAGAISNIILLKFLPYSIVFPMTSLTYVWTVILSYFIFKEKITIRKVVAIGTIIFGVFIISL